MSKKSGALKFGAAGMITALYATAVARKWLNLDGDQVPVTKEKLTIVAGSLTVLTWVAALA